MPLDQSLAQTLTLSLENGDAVAPNSTETTEGFCLLNSRGFVGIIGKDAEKFMQGQLTCDVTTITEQTSSLGAHCTAKGRAVANFRLAKTADENYLFSLPADNCATLRASLGKYIVFSKAKLSDQSNDYFALGLSGSRAQAWLQDHDAQPSQVDETIKANFGLVICTDTAVPRYELWLSREQLQQLWAPLNAALTPMHPQQWYRQNINLGVAEITAALSEELIPQMFRLDELNGISFTKGCYTGQEIIARLKYLGKQKRLLVKFEQDGAPPTIGRELNNASGKSIGRIVAALAEGTNTIGLAVVAASALEDTGSLKLTPFTTA